MFWRSTRRWQVAVLVMTFAIGLAAQTSTAVGKTVRKGSGTVQIPKAAQQVETRKSTAQSAAEGGNDGLGEKCKREFQEFKDFDSYYKSFAYGAEGKGRACAFGEGESDALDRCDGELRKFGGKCHIYAKQVDGKIKIVGQIAVSRPKKVPGQRKAGQAGGKISASVKSRALKKAKVSAWKSYTKKFSTARMKTYRELKEGMLEELDEFFVEVKERGSKIDKDAGTYTIFVRAEINVPAVEAYFQEHSVAATQGSGEGSAFVFLFVARKESSIKTYQQRVVKIEAAEESTSSKESAASGGGKVVSGASQKSMSRKQSGGSSERKASKHVYEIESPLNVNAKMTDILTTAGFEVIPYDDLINECGDDVVDAVNLDAVNKAASSADRIPGSMRKKMIRAARECEVQYFALGTLDMGMADVDKSRGNKFVFTSARGQVWSLAKRLPRTVASVGPVQIKGWGENDVVAGRSSLIKSAGKVASTIVEQLSAKGLR